VPHGKKPVTQWKPEIVRVEFDESTAKQRRVTKSQSKRISFKLKMSAKNGHAE